MILNNLFTRYQIDIAPIVRYHKTDLSLNDSELDLIVYILDKLDNKESLDANVVYSYANTISLQESFSSLLDKKILLLFINSDLQLEFISIKPLFDKLEKYIQQSNRKESSTAIQDKYKTYIIDKLESLWQRKLQMTELQVIYTWFDELGYSQDKIEKAIDKAAKEQKFSINYISRILGEFLSNDDLDPKKIEEIENVRKLLKGNKR